MGAVLPAPITRFDAICATLKRRVRPKAARAQWLKVPARPGPTLIASDSDNCRTRLKAFFAEGETVHEPDTLALRFANKLQLGELVKPF
jgi:hypothetical protein